MTGKTPLRFPLPTQDEQADLVEKHQVDDLLYCKNSWALRHRFINRDTGEVVRARCNRWDCLHCGPHEMDMWRQLIVRDDDKGKSEVSSHDCRAKGTSGDCLLVWFDALC